MREATAATFGHDRVEVAIKLPVLELVENSKHRFRADAALERGLEFVGIETIGKLDKCGRHGIEESILVEQQVTADFAHSIARAEILAFFTNQQLHNRVRIALGKLQRIIVTRQHRCLIELERCLEVRAADQEFAHAIDEFFHDLASVLHDLSKVDRRMKVTAADTQAIQEAVKQVVRGYIDLACLRRR